MQLHLVTRLGPQQRPPVYQGEQLLLEGEWRASEAGKRSLNQQATARFAWIDGEVDSLHRNWLGTLERDGATSVDLLPESLLALELRYYLVKLARFVAVVDELLSSGRFTGVTLWRSLSGDEDYGDLAEQLCRKWRISLTTKDGADSSQRCEAAARQARVQRYPVGLTHAARAARAMIRGAVTFVRRVDGRSRSARGAAAPIVLCGDPAHLGPLIESLRRQTDAPLYWLCERVSQRQYVRWRPRGVRFLDCDTVRGPSVTDRFAFWRPADDDRDRLIVCDVDVGPSVRSWLAARWQRQEGRLARCRAQIQEHFRPIGARWLVVDEDATPLKRLAVAVARQQGISSAVVQHGAPYISFGFAPLAADVVFAWGESSRRQFERWGIARDRIRVTGSPKHDAQRALLPSVAGRFERNGHSSQLVLFASVHHSEDRPDVVSLQFTAASNAEMVRMTLRALRTLPEFRLVIKLHPRTRDSEFFGQLVAEFPDLKRRVRLVRRCRNERLVRGAACVLSCFSSAGIEALLCGVPVIELMPAGSADLLVPGDWPLAGTARTHEELESCLAAVLSGARAAPTRGRVADVFANLERPASPRIAAMLGAKRDAFSFERTGPEAVERPACTGAILT